jgi:hypothetical protein
MLYTIEPNAITALEETKKLKPQSRGGYWMDTRKNPHAIAVGSRLDIVPSCWFVIWTEI